MINTTQTSPWSTNQKKVVIASFLGWMLDAFDFFIMVFILKDIATEFHASIEKVTFLIMLTLAMRPFGALIFGRLADHFGRRKILMISIASYSILEFLSGFAPTLTALFIIRGLFGIAMGAEWGIGSALTMESIPVQSRGFISGLLQTGYPSGYLLASVIFGLFYALIGWRGMFMIGILPALLVFYIRRHIAESPVWEAAEKKHIHSHFLSTLKKNWQLTIYSILLMTAFNFFSHGTQDLYPLFLETQHHFDTHLVSFIAVIYNIGAILGGLVFGIFSERIGRRYACALAAIGALLILPAWAFSNTPFLLGLSAFLMQFMVQGAWGIVPAHLNELSPGEIRATFPGFVYQLGNLLASANATLQAMIAMHFQGLYSFGLAIVAGIVAICLLILILLGPEKRGEVMTI